MAPVRIALVGLLALGAVSAHASLITIDPSLFSEGTDLSHIRSSVSLSAMSNPGYRTDDEGNPISPSPSQFLPIIAVQSIDDSSAMMFGHPDNGIWDHSFANEGMAARYVAGEPGLNFGFTVFRADFASNTNFVQLIVRGCCGDFPRVDFWGLDGELIGTCSTPAARAEHDEGCNVVNVGDLSNASPDYQEPWLMSWTSNTANIGFVTSGGWAGGGEVHQITFNSVPEPGTLVLFAVGILGLATMRNRLSRNA